jgi:hypothetical protein
VQQQLGSYRKNYNTTTNNNTYLMNASLIQDIQPKALNNNNSEK